MNSSCVYDTLKRRLDLIVAKTGTELLVHLLLLAHQNR